MCPTDIILTTRGDECGCPEGSKLEIVGDPRAWDQKFRCSRDNLRTQSPTSGGQVSTPNGNQETRAPPPSPAENRIVAEEKCDNVAKDGKFSDAYTCYFEVLRKFESNESSSVIRKAVTALINVPSSSSNPFSPKK